MAKNKKKKNGQKKNQTINNSNRINENINLEKEPLNENNNTKEDQKVIVNDLKNKETIKKQKATKIKKEKRPSKVGKKVKESFSELKKVTWPTFPKVVKQTGVVLGVVVFFALVLFGFDYILKFLFKLINKVEYTSGELWGSVGIAGSIILVILIWTIVFAVKKKKKENK